ncbi:DUF3768 domain-containing protein [Pseudomonas syringae pv. actinidiae]|nr:DUF3768 domain-containing protein [Pseudomonas syringae pv. actinidiae]
MREPRAIKKGGVNSIDICGSFDRMHQIPLKLDDSMQDRSVKTPLQQMNDLFRQTPASWNINGRTMMTAAVAELLNSDPEKHMKVMATVVSYDNFSEDNDPYMEHDYASFTVDGDSFFFKIDYYDRNYEYGCASEDRLDPEKCRRVLTVGFASDY